MITLNMNVENKRITFDRASESIVCGNNDYQIEFAFDSEWNAYSEKTARFVWNNRYFDQEFTGNVCPVPPIENATEVEVGVYAGDGNLCTTTGTIVDCVKSILSKNASANPGTGANYTNEARGYAASAKASAERAEEAAEQAASGGGMKEVDSVTFTVYATISTDEDDNEFIGFRLGDENAEEALLDERWENPLNLYWGVNYTAPQSVRKLFEDSKLLTVDFGEGLEEWGQGKPCVMPWKQVSYYVTEDNYYTDALSNEFVLSQSEAGDMLQIPAFALHPMASIAFDNGYGTLIPFPITIKGYK